MKKLANTSCDSFNALFEKRIVDDEYYSYVTGNSGTLTQGIKTPKESYNELIALLKFARSVYISKRETAEWKGTLNDSSAFIGTMTFALGDCFNCGSSSHSLAQCPKEKNQEEITKRKKKFYELKRNGGGSSNRNSGGSGNQNHNKNDNSNKGNNNGGGKRKQLGLKVPPTNEEKAKAETKGWSNPRRTFSKKGVPTMTYEYNSNSKWWERVDTPSANVGQNDTSSNVSKDPLDLSDINAVAEAFLKKFTRNNDSEGEKQLRHQKALLGLRELFEDLRE